MFSEESGEASGYRIALAAFTLVGICILAVFAIFRETPAFWTNQGGYPLWLRYLVKNGFYPLLFGLFCLLLHLTFVLFARWKGSSRLWCVQASLISVGWLAIFSTAGFAVANNIVNLLEHRSLNAHPIRSYSPDEFSAPKSGT